MRNGLLPLCVTARGRRWGPSPTRARASRAGSSLAPPKDPRQGRERLHARGVVSLPLRTSHGRGVMTVTIGRRELLAALGGAVVAWPGAALAQTPGPPLENRAFPFTLASILLRQVLRGAAGAKTTVAPSWSRRLPLACERVRRL